ncbi:hypothetical protein RHGRI_032281 [Rhododendron griersonianum]|uniref:Uncharacterized protein n=1 Tax=Rhododendron griersonianum TaxID=479676 RepID=A0AAV6IB41_9ERIC|nr:hypothetical protein RHGRI_032281 [Rhododendron griersonianum]
MEGSSLTNEEIEAALQLIQLISSGSRRRDTTIGRFKLEEEEYEEREDIGSTAAAYSSSPSPSSIKKILQRKNGSFGERKRSKLLLSSTGAQIRSGIQNEMKAAEQLLHLSEEEGEGGGRQESGSNISEAASYVTDASSAVAMETRADQERESEAKQGGGGGGGGGRSKSNRRGLSSSYMEEGEGDFMEEECCLADFLCRRRKRKFRSLIDIYTITNPSNGSRD